ncbi:MAG: GumC family protein [Hyphomicrobiales bacterium]
MAEWDSPLIAEHNSATASRDSRANNQAVNKPRQRNEDGLLDPLAFIRFIFGNLGKIILLTLLLTIISIGLFQLIPFPYTAKAIILVDPREKGIKVSEQVVTNIDGDAAVLASIVELVQSDGFLRPLLEPLNVASDPQFEKASKFANAGDNRQLLEAFRKGLSVLRIGATYVVEVKYTSSDAQKSATYANGVAKAFIKAQSTSQIVATTNAANSLSGRLSDLRDSLQKSEKAVADFRTKNNIVNVDAASTLKQRALVELSQQVAQAKSQTEIWRAQHDQVLNSNGNIFNTLGDQAENQQLQALGQQRNLINQNLAELNLIFGARHPRIAAEQSKLTSLDQQITLERQRLVALSKRRLDAAVATETALQNDLNKLRDEVAGTETALVTLGELEREATANREIYQNFLSRFKSTDQQQGFQNQQARLVSEATAPLSTNRPSMVLASGIISLVSFILSTMIIFLRAAMSGEKPAFQQTSVARTQPSYTQHDEPESHTPVVPPYQPPQQLDFRPPPPVLTAPVTNKSEAPDYVSRDAHIAPNRNTVIKPLDNYTFKPPKHSKSTVAAQSTMAAENIVAPEHIMSTKHAEPIAGLTHIPRSNLRSEFDLELALANQLTEVPALLPDLNSTQQNGYGTVILVSSWFPREGKTLISQSIATLAATNHFDSILVKTPTNSEVESQRGLSSSSMYRPYSVLDPVAESKRNLPVDFKSFSALEAIIEECRKTFGLIILDASHVSNETHFSRLSAASDKTLIILDRPDENKIGIIAERTIKSDFKDVKIVLNNL